jgi:hypothetical protein
MTQEKGKIDINAAEVNDDLNPFSGEVTIPLSQLPRQGYVRMITPKGNQYGPWRAVDADGHTQKSNILGAPAAVQLQQHVSKPHERNQ